MAKFFLRTSQKEGTGSLYLRVNRPKLNISWWVCSGINVNIKEWNKAQGSPKALTKYFATEKGKEVQNKMEEVEGVIKDLFKKKVLTCNDDKPKLDKAIMDVINVKAIKALEEVEEEKREEQEKQQRGIINYYDYFMQSIVNGTIRKGKNGKEYQENSQSVWRTFGNHLHDYLKFKGDEAMTFDSINRAFADGFVAYLENKGLMAGTINQQVICFRRLCNAAAEDERNYNLISVKVWHERKVDERDKRAEIVLSDDEVDALYNMKLDGLREQVRDVWMLGYMSAQRVSDYSIFTKDNFKVTKRGLPVIVLQQKKTQNDVVVPILDDRVAELCHKYDYDFPKLTRDTINRQIKLILKDLASTLPSLNEWNRTLLSVRERQKEHSYLDLKERVANGEKLHGEESKRYKRMKAYADEHDSGDMLWKRDYSGAVIKQRWELVTCHTSRRSAVTSMYDTGLYDVRDMMSISGHTTISNFERYIKRGSIEQAERIADKFTKAKNIKLRRKAE